MVGSTSLFLFTWDYQTIRRKGCMTTEQRKKREAWELIWKPKPGDLAKSFSRAVVEPLEKLAREGAPLVLNTDEHPLYPKVLSRSCSLLNRFKTGLYTHHRYNSHLARTYQSPLFGVNYMDRELRKDLANHVRETTRYSREANHMVERVSIFAVDHNLNKKFRIKSKNQDTSWHWKEAGLPEIKVKTGMGEKFWARPWRQEDFLGFLKRMWDRDIPGPRTRAQARMADFWRH